MNRKTMVRTVYAVCGIAVIGGLAYAAGPLATGRFSAGQARLYGGVMDRTQAGAMFERAAGAFDAALELGLTSEQRTQLKPIVARAAMALHQARMSGSSPEAKAAQAKAAIDAALQSARNVLNPEQMAKVEAFRARIDDIGITPEQRAKLHPIAAEAREEAAAVRADTSLSAEQKKARLAAILVEARREAGTVLTPEQQAKIRAIRDDGYLVNVIDHALDLTDAQENALRETLRSAFAQADRVQADPSLTPEQRTARLMAIHTATRTRIEASLTPAQVRKAEALKAQFQQFRRQREQQGGTRRPRGGRLRG